MRNRATFLLGKPQIHSQLILVNEQKESVQDAVKCEANCMYCMKVYDTVDNWIIKANLTKACAPPPTERRCQRSVTSSIYVH